MLPAEKRLKTKEQLRQWLACDKARYGKIGRLEYLLQCSERSILYRHQVLLRKTEYLFNNHRRIWRLYALRLQRKQNRYALHIPLNTCGKGLYVVHVGPVLFNSAAEVGEYCTFHMNTGLVAGGTNNDAPVLEDHVILGIGSVVLGNTHIASGVAVGANAVVNRDVLEPNITVAGVPAKKISNSSRADWNKKT
jgi:serine O-acetyltransferase